jgi:hypothetical protein
MELARFWRWVSVSFLSRLLDDSAQALHGAAWSVDDPARACIQEEDGLMVVHSKAAGTVRVPAALGGEVLSRNHDLAPGPAFATRDDAMGHASHRPGTWGHPRCSHR